MQKRLITSILTILIASIMLAGCGKAAENMFYFPESIETGNINDLTLTIYYMSFFSFTSAPVQLKDLTGGWWCEQREQYIRGIYERRIVISGSRLRSQRDLINQLFTTELNPTGKEVVESDRVFYVWHRRIFPAELPVLCSTRNEALIDARLYYVFEHREYGEIFSVLVSGGGSSGILANGISVEYESIFIEMVLSFLPRREADSIRRLFRL